MPSKAFAAPAATPGSALSQAAPEGGIDPTAIERQRYDEGIYGGGAGATASPMKVALTGGADLTVTVQGDASKVKARTHGAIFTGAPKIVRAMAVDI